MFVIKHRSVSHPTSTFIRLEDSSNRIGLELFFFNPRCKLIVFFIKIVSEMPMKRTSTLNLYLTSDSFHAHKAQCSGNEHPAQQQVASKPRSKFDRKAKLGKCPVPSQGCPGRPVSGRNAEITGFRTEAGRGKCRAFDLPPSNCWFLPWGHQFQTYPDAAAGCSGCQRSHQ